jgi:hypothetical protein
MAPSPQGVAKLRRSGSIPVKEKRTEMNRRRVPFTLWAVFMVAGSVGVMNPARAAVVSNTTYTFSQDFYNDCTQELMHIEAFAHAVLQMTVDENGVKHLGFHFDAKATSIEVSSGNVYLAAPLHDEFTVNTTGNGTVSHTEEYSFLFVTKGNVPNWRVHWIQHFVINPDGTTTVSVDNPRSECSP